MRRYYTLARPPRPRADDDEFGWMNYEPKEQNLTVYEPQEQHVFSGLYNEQGEPLYRAAMQPIGFLAQHEN